MRAHRLVASLMVVVLALGGVTEAVPPECVQATIDVDGCGPYPPLGTCVLINTVGPTFQGCCRKPFQQYEGQYLLQEHYDCTGDGLSDCRYDLFYSQDTPLCPPF